jgi:hypothetical protein
MISLRKWILIENHTLNRKKYSEKISSSRDSLRHPREIDMTYSPAQALTAFHAPHAPDDDRLVRGFAEQLNFTGAEHQSIDARATKLIKAIRSHAGQIGGVEDFLREYGLSTREGLALMVLAEALLRVPDALTQDRLIEDKLKEGGWSDHESHGDTWFVSASAWALGMSARVIKPGETPEGVMRGLVKRMGHADGAHSHASGNAVSGPSFRAWRNHRRCA